MTKHDDGAMTRRTLVAGSAATAAVFAGPAVLAGPVPVPSPRADHVDGGRLSPGDFIWAPELSPEGPVVVIVSLPDQLVHVYRNGVKIAVSTCSTGKPGHRTPTGVFVVLQKDRDHHSSTYANAPMPNMQRLTWSGIALHAGRLPGYPASHGCVRLPLRFSELLFGITHLGIPVIIADEASEPASVVHPGIVLPDEAEKEALAAMAAAGARSHHQPSTRPGDGSVVSMVLSGASRILELLKDGAPALTARIEIADPQRPLGTHLFKLLGTDATGTTPTWLAHEIAPDGHEAAMPEAVLSRIVVRDWVPVVEFLADVRPGSVLLVTDEPIGGDARSGPGFVILDATA